LFPHKVTLIASENFMNNKSDLLDEPENFSLALGGPLFQLYLRTRLSGPALDLLVRRIVVIAAIAWLPLLLLAALQGNLSGGVQVPFLFALDTHVRLLVALPLLIAAELYVHEWSRGIVAQFRDRGLVASEDRMRFNGIIDSALRLRNSVILELLLIVIAFAGHWAAVSTTLTGSTWYGAWVDGRLHFTPAGYWAVLISFPLFRFIVLRWYFRLFIWYRFLWQVARLPLRLNTLHPDRAGGLGFLALSMFAFAPVLLVQTIIASGAIANRIWHEGAQLPAFKLEIAGILIFLLLVALIPLTFFSGQLMYAKRKGVREYSSVASAYVRDFRDKWIEGRNPEGERLLGTGDIQSLADLGNSFAVAGETRVVPFGKEQVFSLAIILVAPLLPLLLTVIPLEEMIDRILALLL
jgi:hypothetical protein